MAALPKDFPPHTTVYNYFWDGADTVRSIAFIRRCSNTAATRAAVSPIRRQQSSIRRLRKRPKRGASLDPVGYDAGKKTKGIKRNVIVDTEAISSRSR